MRVTKMQRIYDIIASIADENGIAKFNYDDISTALAQAGITACHNTIKNACRNLVIEGKLIHLTDRSRHGRRAVFQVVARMPKQIPARITVDHSRVEEIALETMHELAAEFIACGDRLRKLDIAGRFGRLRELIVYHPNDLVMECEVPIDTIVRRLVEMYHAKEEKSAPIAKTA